MSKVAGAMHRILMSPDPVRRSPESRATQTVRALTMRRGFPNMLFASREERRTSKQVMDIA
jgi:phosphohistidine phosphatase SixA